jgi:hypothetical protein
MASSKAALALLGILSSIGLMSPMFADSACAKLQNADAPSLLAYLQGGKEGLDRDCVLFAIRELGNNRHAASIKTLVAYLDVRLPDPRNLGTRERPIIIARIVPPGGLYAASIALSQIGQAAVPDLLEVIANASTSELVRDNAADTLFTIYRAQPQAIVAIVSAAHARTAPMDSLRLMDQARRLASLCIPGDRNECENAVLRWPKP